MFGLLGEFQSTFPIRGGGRGGQTERPICVPSRKGTITLEEVRDRETAQLTPHGCLCYAIQRHKGES